MAERSTNAWDWGLTLPGTGLTYEATNILYPIAQLFDYRDWGKGYENCT